MKSINIINKLNTIISDNTLNNTQKSIAKNLIIDDNFEFSESKSIVYIFDKKLNIKYNFISYIKSKCNCD